jgi:hypothetical protein
MLIINLDQSRRDDLESLGFMLVYFYKSSLPWQGIKDKNFQRKLETIFRMKTNTTLKDLCSDMPPEFVIYFEYCRSLKFDQQPDYKYLIKLFEGVLLQMQHDPEEIEFDWEPKKEDLINLKRRSSLMNVKLTSVHTLGKLRTSEVLNFSKSPEVELKKYTFTKEKEYEKILTLLKLDLSPTKSCFRNKDTLKKKLKFANIVTIFNHNEEGEFVSKEEKQINLKDGSGQFENSSSPYYKDLYVRNTSQNTNDLSINPTSTIDLTGEEKERKDSCIIF